MKDAKFVRLFSDIHLDFDIARYSNMELAKKDRLPELDVLWYPMKMDTDLETVLVIAGDMWTDNRAFVRRNGAETSWIEVVASRFHSVVMVLGNHDYWGGSLDRAVTKARESLSALGLKNVHLLEKSSVILGDIKFLGGTLWTDFKRGDPIVKNSWRTVMVPDHKNITFGSGTVRRGVRAQDLYETHLATWKYIKQECKRDHKEQKVIVVTHMAPSIMSVHPRYYTAPMTNYFYYSDLENDVASPEFDADYYFHGHTHDVSDYMLGDTRVIANPRGYAGHENTGYDTEMRLDFNSEM